MTDTTDNDTHDDAKAAKAERRDDRRCANLEAKLNASIAARQATEAQIAATQAEIDKLSGKGGDDADGARWRELEDENNALRGEIESVQNAARSKALVTAVAEVAGLGDTFLVRAALREAHDMDPDAFDLAPKEVTPKDVRYALAALTRHAPSLFARTGQGGTARNRPGPAPVPWMGGVPEEDQTDAEMWQRRGAAADPLADLKRLRQPGRRFG